MCITIFTICVLYSITGGFRAARLHRQVTCGGAAMSSQVSVGLPGSGTATVFYMYSNCNRVKPDPPPHLSND